MRCAHAWGPFPPLSFPPVFFPFFLLSPLLAQPLFGDHSPVLEASWDTSLLVPRAQVRGAIGSEGRAGGLTSEAGYGGGMEGQWPPALLPTVLRPVWGWGWEWGAGALFSVSISVPSGKRRLQWLGAGSGLCPAVWPGLAGSRPLGLKSSLGKASPGFNNWRPGSHPPLPSTAACPPALPAWQGPQAEVFGQRSLRRESVCL